MKVVALKAENFKRLKAVEIKPVGNTVVVSGANEQGKSSLLDSIWWVIGGAEMVKSTGTKQPIRNGEKKATVRLDLGDIVATRTATESGDRLTVENKDGDVKRSPQAVLDALVSKVAFDPLSFAVMDERKQRESLLSMVNIGVNLDQLAASRKEAYDKRTEEGRTLKQIQGQIAGSGGFNDDTPDVESSGAAVIEEMNAAIEHNNSIDRADRDVAVLLKQAESFEVSEKNMQARINDLEAQIDSLKAEKLLLTDKAGNARLLYKQTSENVAKMERKPIDGYRSKIENVESTNRAVRAKKQHAVVVARGVEIESKISALTKAIDEIDKTKTDALASAKFPVDGLSFSDTGVIYKGVPFSQCSSAERLRVSIAIAMAANPKLRVIRITDGSLLDKKNMAIIEEMAAANDYQIWVEKVDESGKVGIYIENGEVRAEANG